MIIKIHAFTISMTALVVVIIILLFIILSLMKSNSKAVRWGKNFGGIDAKNVPFNCSLNGHPMCCEAFDSSHEVESSHHFTSRGIGNDYELLKQHNKKHHSSSNNHCYMNKTYISSDFELFNIYYALILDQISDLKQREDKLLQLIYSNDYIHNSTKWLNRVKYHVSTPHIINIPTKDDYIYLSRFEMSVICSSHTGSTSSSSSSTGKSSNTSHNGSSGTGGAHPSHTWIEWIEPLTLTARHPFAMAECKKVRDTHTNSVTNSNSTTGVYSKNNPSVGLGNIDYILLQSGEALYNQQQYQQLHIQHSPSTTTALRHPTTPTAIGGASSGTSTSGSTINGAASSSHKRSKHFMLDLGSSTFTSSLKWFACGYSQVRFAYG